MSTMVKERQVFTYDVISNESKNSSVIFLFDVVAHRHNYTLTMHKAL